MSVLKSALNGQEGGCQGTSGLARILTSSLRLDDQDLALAAPTEVSIIVPVNPLRGELFASVRVGATTPRLLKYLHLRS